MEHTSTIYFLHVVVVDEFDFLRTQGEFKPPKRHLKGTHAGCCCEEAPLGTGTTELVTIELPRRQNSPRITMQETFGKA